jgi:hypothetical protein
MDLIKRHMWLVVTLVVMVGLSVGPWVAMAICKGQRAEYVTVLKKSRSALSGIKKLYTDDAGATLNKAAEHRKEQIAAIEKYVLQSGKWRPLVPGIFPKYRSEPEVYKFKERYRKDKFNEFRETLGGVIWDNDRGGVGLLPQDATMYIQSKAFYKNPWIDLGTLGTDRKLIMQHLVERQDDLWLQEDIVAALKQSNDACFDSDKVDADRRTVAMAVVKELHEIRIGVQFLPRGRSSRRSTRYLYIGDEPAPELADWGMGGQAEEQPEAEDVKGQAPTLTGRASDNNGGRYYVLPFKVVMIVDAGKWPEIVRQMTGSRSFITVLNLQYEQMPEVESVYDGFLARSDPKERVFVYGPRPIGRLTLWCESLVFRLKGARPTVLPKARKSGT